MEGISKDELIEVRKGLLSEGLNTDVIDALITLKVKELQEPWMTLEEFLKSGFEGECWINLINGEIRIAYASNEFYYSFLCKNFESFQLRSITHVMPIHKPEPPR